MVTANSQGQSVHDCAIVGKDVIDQTRSQLEDDWKKVDAWIREREQRRQQR